MSEKKIPTSEVEKIKGEIIKSVEKVIKYFKDNPFLFMSERDLQAHLLCLLRKKTERTLEFQYKDKKHKINIINTEYSDYIDIVCLHPIKAEEEIEKHSAKKDKLDQYLWRLPLLVGIEIKLIRFDYNQGAERGDIDKQKLKEFNEKYNKVEEFVWLVLCFYQNKEKLKKLTGKKYYNNNIEFDKIYLIGDEELYVRTGS